MEGIGLPRVLFVVTCCLMLHTVRSQSNEAVLDFDCRRQGSACSGATACDVSTGSCSCGNLTDVDYKCGDNSPSGSCGSPCENGAVCVNSVCNCGESYYGATCNMNRVQVDCDGSTMFLNVNPDVTSFSGKIFVLGIDLPECTLTDSLDSSEFGDFVENPSDIQGYRIQLPHTGSGCGDVTATNETDEQGNQYSSYKREFLVRHSLDFVTLLDQVVVAECRVAEGGSMVYSKPTVVNETQAGDFENVDVNTSVQTVTMSVLNGDGSTIVDPVRLGASIQLVFTLTPSSGFEDFYISSCEANNTDPDESTVKRLPFITDRCPTINAYSLFTTGLTKSAALTETDPVRIRINMKAFMFLGDFSQVAFVCDVVLCNSVGDQLCQPPAACNGLVSSEAAEDLSPPPTDDNKTYAPTEAPPTDNQNATSAGNNAGNSTTDSQPDNQTPPSNQTTDDSTTSNEQSNNATTEDQNGDDSQSTNSTATTNDNADENNQSNSSTDDSPLPAPNVNNATTTSAEAEAGADDQSDATSSSDDTEAGDSAPSNNGTDLSAADQSNVSDVTDVGGDVVDESSNTENGTETETSQADTSDAEDNGGGEDTGSDTDNALNKRKRRSTGERDQVSAVFQVYDPSLGREDAISKLEQSLTSRDCMNQPEVLACVAILSVLVMLLLGLTVILTFSHMRHNNNRDKSCDPGFPQTHPEAMRIPRLEMRTQPYSNISTRGC